MRSVGFTGFAPKKETWGLHLNPNPLSFSDNQVLIATFITREEVTRLARRDQLDDALPLRLHGIFLDADTGKVRATKEWPLTRPRGGIVGAGEGRFAVLTPAMIALYAPNFELLRDFKLSSEQQAHLWDFRSSPTGKSFVVEYHYPDALFQWVDTNTLIPRPTSIPTVVFSISDDDVVITRNPYIESKGFLSEVLIRGADGSWRTICRVLNGGGCGLAQFLSNETVALWSSHGFLVVPNTGSYALLNVSFRSDEWLGYPQYPAADGERFAVTVWEHKGGSAFFDISYRNVLKRIVVYDLPSRQAVYALDAKRQKIKDISGVALSPDGSLMAILADGVVEVYQLLPRHTEAGDVKDRTLHQQIPIPDTVPKQSPLRGTPTQRQAFVTKP